MTDRRHRSVRQRNHRRRQTSPSARLFSVLPTATRTRLRATPNSSSNWRLPSATCLPSTVPTTPFPVIERKSRASVSFSPLFSAPPTIAAASGCSLPRSRLAARRRISSLALSRRWHQRRQVRLALGERAGFIHYQGVDLFQHLQGFGVLDQHARHRAAPRANHDRHRRRQAESARTGDDQHGDGVEQPIRHRWLRSEQGPDNKSDNSDQHHRRNKIAGDDVRQLLNRRAASLSLRQPCVQSAPEGCRCRRAPPS